MVKELKVERPDLEINLLGMNQKGNELGNPIITADRTLPWLQDVDANGDGDSDVWLGSWQVEWRDVVILDKNNVKTDVYNLTLNDLADQTHYQLLKSKLIAAAEAAKASPSFSWTNATNKLDVNNDSSVSPMDALLVVNELNTVGGHALSALTQAPTAYLDTTEDGFVSPMDALLVINELSRKAAEQNQQPAAALPAVVPSLESQNLGEGEQLISRSPSATSDTSAETLSNAATADPSSLQNALYAAAVDTIWSDLATQQKKRTDASS